MSAQRSFASNDLDAAMRSARLLAPAIMNMYPHLNSVIEAGCETPQWLARFKELGVKEIVALYDRHANLDDMQGLMPEECHAADLANEWPVRQRFDLCLCMGYGANILPEQALHLVLNLCALADVVVFSSPLPGQNAHDSANTQWPSYWQGLFKTKGYEAIDVLRGKIWNDARIDWAYRQNLIVYANAAGRQRLKIPASATPIDIVHPECFARYRAEAEKAKMMPVIPPVENFSHAMIKARDARIVETQSEIEERNAHIASLNAEIALRDARIVETQSEIEERNAYITALNNEIEVRDTRLAQQAVVLRQALLDKKRYAHFYTQARTNYEAIQNSTSWRLLMPLRKIVSWMPSWFRIIMRRVVRQMSK